MTFTKEEAEIVIDALEQHSRRCIHGVVCEKCKRAKALLIQFRSTMHVILIGD